MSDDPEDLPDDPIPMSELLPRVRPGVFDALDRIRRKAAMGLISGVAIVATTVDGTVITTWDCKDTYMTTLGGVAWLQQRMAEEGG